MFLKLATDHDEVSFYFSLAFSISHLGTFLAFFVEPAIARASSAGSVCLPPPFECTTEMHACSLHRIDDAYPYYTPTQ